MSEYRKNAVRPTCWNKRLWILFGMAWVFAPIWFGWFFAQRIECSSCFREVFIHSLAFFGYVVLGGFVYSFSKPPKSTLTFVEAVTPNGYMLGTREDVLFAFVLLGAFLAGFSFFSIYQF